MTKPSTLIRREFKKNLQEFVYEPLDESWIVEQDFYGDLDSELLKDAILVSR